MGSFGSYRHKYYVTGDSFGADCPDNWEEIADSINEFLDEVWDSATEEEQDEREQHEERAEREWRDFTEWVWENYCTHEGDDYLPLDIDRIRKEWKESR